jgi:hypothetical protein
MHCAMERVTKERADDAGERRGRRRPEAKVGALDVRPGAGDYLLGPGLVGGHLA